MVIKRNQTPYNGISIANSKTKSTNFASDNKYDTSKVYTKLVSSYGWDTALTFIDKTVSNYSTNSNEEIYDQEKHTNTGSSTAVCNIYDMGGNLEEYTSESYSDDVSPYVARGGCFIVSASVCPAGDRDKINGSINRCYGFRPTLYIH